VRCFSSLRWALTRSVGIASSGALSAEFVVGVGLEHALCMVGAHIACEVWHGRMGTTCGEYVRHTLCGSCDPR
jgi:hypothetical protein